MTRGRTHQVVDCAEQFDDLKGVKCQLLAEAKVFAHILDGRPVRLTHEASSDKHMVGELGEAEGLRAGRAEVVQAFSSGCNDEKRSKSSR